MNRLLAAVSATALMVLPAGAFELDPRFVDTDGDLIADIPADAAQWVDPATLIFAYTPVEDPAVYVEVWAEFLDYLSEATGRPVQFFPVQSNAAQIEAMRAGRLHIAGFNTGGVPLAVACAGFRPFTIMAADDGTYGYRMSFITHVDSDIQTIEDLEGRTLAFTSETSNSGFRAPSALLRDEFGMEPGVNFTPAFSGAHDNSVLGVVNMDYDAAAIADEVMFRMAARDVINLDDIRTIYESDPFPTTGYGVVHNLTPELQQQIEDAFFSFDWEGTALYEEFAAFDMTKFMPITFEEHWAVVRDIAVATGTSFACN
ncbi:MAG: phosphate/phosphite/phosphonate ABC transporter substrate-binding protein [Roseinatronobacter sp.]